jgi:selenide,water dikinase
VDASTLDDAGVYRLDSERALVQTVDFFTPILDDPESFGAVAAANSLSDVYAMGGRPLTALNILCFPDQKLSAAVLTAILRGGARVLAEAGVALLGGHSVSDPELKYGLAVTGLVDPRRIWTNARAQPGDALILTKPLGTGVLSTALKKGKLSAGALAAMTSSMLQLNREAAQAAAAFEIHACTDVTGCGLAGHGYEMATASAVALEIELQAVPLLADALRWTERGMKTRGDRLNRDYVQGRYRVEGRPPAALVDLMFDPQTSGGLLFAVTAPSADRLLAALRDTAGAVHSSRIGRVLPPERDRLIFH